MKFLGTISRNTILSESGNAITTKDCCMSIRHIESDSTIFVYGARLLNQKEFDSLEAMISIKNYINSMGMNVDLIEDVFYAPLNSHSYMDIFDSVEDLRKTFPHDEYSTVYKFILHPLKENVQVTLAELSFIRALWSDAYKGLWKTVYKLRSLKALSHLDNYEIWQLAEYGKNYYYYHGVLSDYKHERRIHSVLSIDQLLVRLKTTQLSSVHSKFNIYYQKHHYNADLLDTLRKMFKKKQYLEIYEMMSVKGKRLNAIPIEAHDALGLYKDVVYVVDHSGFQKKNFVKLTNVMSNPIYIKEDKVTII